MSEPRPPIDLRIPAIVNMAADFPPYAVKLVAALLQAAGGRLELSLRDLGELRGEVVWWDDLGRRVRVFEVRTPNAADDPAV